METKFQTSFIPKKPLISDPKVRTGGGRTSILMFISMLVFVASVAGAAYSFLWKGVLIEAQEDYKLRLAENDKRFDTTLIENLKKANIKIDTSKKLLKNHLAVSEIFAIISDLTISGVRFTSFDFSGPEKEGDDVKISMKGVGNSFNDIAFQSLVFGTSEKYGTNKILKNPILSDLVVDTNGKVGFTFTTSVKSEDLLYDKALEASLNSTQ